MNRQISVIEPETLEYLPAKTILRLTEQSQNVNKYNIAFANTVKRCPVLFRRLEELDIDVKFSLREGDIDLSFTGDGARLGEVWSALRHAGYLPDNRPTKGEAVFCTHWRQEGFAILWMNFSSSVCRRVKVGTKMVEQDVYEVQCGELPELDADASKQNLTVVDGSFDDIPF